MLRSEVVSQVVSGGCTCEYGDRCLRLILDSGASKHVGCPSLVVEKTPLQRLISLQSAFGDVEHIVDHGSVLVNTLMGGMRIQNVLCCGRVKNTVILSIRQLIVDLNLQICFGKDEAIALRGKQILLRAVFDRSLGNYIIHTDSVTAGSETIYQLSENTLLGTLWHNIMGHCSRKYLVAAGLPPPRPIITATRVLQLSSAHTQRRKY